MTKPPPVVPYSFLQKHRRAHTQRPTVIPRLSAYQQAEAVDMLSVFRGLGGILKMLCLKHKCGIKVTTHSERTSGRGINEDGINRYTKLHIK